MCGGRNQTGREREGQPDAVRRADKNAGQTRQQDNVGERLSVGRPGIVYREFAVLWRATKGNSE